MAEHADGGARRRTTRGRSTGSTGRRAPPRPKGRQVEPAALDEVRGLLGATPRTRDFLLDHLHRLQDRFGHLSARHLAALALELRLAQAEVFEVASFYAHFDIVAEGESPPPPLTVRVCDGISCELAGADAVADAIGARADAGVRILRAPCMGACDRAPVAAVGHRTVLGATPDALASLVAGAPDPQPDRRPDPPPRLVVYREAGGYRLLEDCLAGRRTPEEVIAILEDGALRGMGGAGFPTGRKWHLVRSGAAPRMMAVNADEGEPGTFKDGHFLRTDPHRVLEGMLIAAWAVGAGQVVVYLRDEYPDCRALLERELAALDAAGLSRHVAVRLVRGAGAYICGEESAMLESIEGRRPLPRHKPPFPAQSGLFGRPTLINNVETLYWVRDIVERGPSWWAEQGRNGAKGLRALSVSGRIREPGVKIVPAGITLNELISEQCGGMAEGHRLKAYLPGGASGGLLPASMADLPLDFGVLEPHGCFVGSGAVVVLSDRDDLRSVALNLLRFFADESCGQCTPCRVGTEKAVTLIETAPGEHALLEDLARVMTDASICGLGQAAMNPVRAILRHFPEELA